MTNGNSSFQQSTKFLQLSSSFRSMSVMHTKKQRREKMRVSISRRTFIQVSKQTSVCVYALINLDDGTRSSGNSWPHVSTFLGNWARDSRSLHFTLRVDDNTSIVLKENEDTILPSPWLSLSDNDSRHDLLSQFRLTLLDSGHEHVTNTGGWQSVQSTLDTLDRDDIQVLGTRVISTVHDSTNWQSSRQSEFGTSSTTSSSLGHFDE